MGAVHVGQDVVVREGLPGQASPEGRSVHDPAFPRPVDPPRPDPLAIVVIIVIFEPSVNLCRRQSQPVLELGGRRPPHAVPSQIIVRRRDAEA